MNIVIWGHGQGNRSVTGSELVEGHERKGEIKSRLLDDLQEIPENDEEKKGNVRRLASLVERGIVEIRLFLTLTNNR